MLEEYLERLGAAIPGGVMQRLRIPASRHLFSFGSDDDLDTARRVDFRRIPAHLGGGVHGFMGSWAHGLMGPWVHGSMGFMGTWGHGVIFAPRCAGAGGARLV